uniref:Ras-associating domain-containing protein n=1 Tax=Heterorhabditis bacteriophora TaxID=37862 RepID=A0A1I7XPT0_HETBA
MMNCDSHLLIEQLKLAEDMGFPQDVVIAAVNMQKKDVDGMYQPFESTNAMLDILNQASGRSETPKMKLSVYNEEDKRTIRRIWSPKSGFNNIKIFSEHSSSYRPITGRSSSVSRSSSFHMGCPRIPRSESQDLSRLMQTFEKERERDKVEVESQFAILKTKIDVLERDKELLVRKERQMHEEVNLLKKSAESHVKDLQELQGQNDHLKQELSEAIGMCDKLVSINMNIYYNKIIV